MNALAPFLQVEITEVSRLVFSGDCVKLVAPAAYGEVCILPRHAPFLTRLQPGEVRLETHSGENHFFFLSGGYLEVKDNNVSILADQMWRSNEIDRQAALEAKHEAEIALKKGGILSDPIRFNLAKAIVQLRVLEHAEVYRLKNPHG